MPLLHPLTPETVDRVKEFAPDRVVLVPLYPQYSSNHDRVIAGCLASIGAKEWVNGAHHIRVLLSGASGMGSMSG